MKLDEQAKIVRRLRCAAGHLNAVIEMAETGQPCEQVLHQLNAVQAALRAAGIKLIRCQVQSSQTVILNSPSSDQRVAELKRFQSLYTILTQYSIPSNEVIHDSNPL